LKGKDEIKDFFSDKLGNFEAPVRPDLWTNIASQIGTGTTVAASTGLSLLTKSIIGVGIISAAVVTAIIVITPNTAPQTKTSINTIETNEKEPTIIKEIEGSTENIKPEQEKTSIETVKNNSPKTEQIDEIDPNQNFKTDISLIQPLKERLETGLPEKKESDNKTQAEEQKTTKKQTEIKENTSNKTVKESVEEKQTVKTEKNYSLGELPNIFTPNGDGNNDFLFIESEGLVDFTIVVLDNKQKVIFESNDPNFKWNGIDKFGNTVAAGSYGYYIIASDKNGNKVNKFIALEIRL